MKLTFFLRLKMSGSIKFACLRCSHGGSAPDETTTMTTTVETNEEKETTQTGEGDFSNEKLMSRQKISFHNKLS